MVTIQMNVGRIKIVPDSGIDQVDIVVVEYDLARVATVRVVIRKCCGFDVAVGLTHEY